MVASAVEGIETQDVVELTRRLIRFNTANPPGNEEEAIRYLGEYLAAAGIAVEYQQVEPARANLIARLRGSNDTGHLIFSGHMDVVSPGDEVWQHDPFAAHLVDGRIVGRGAADMKGGVAAMAVAMATLARAGFTPRSDLVLAVSAGEERMAPGARHMVATRCLEGGAYLIVGEPTGLDVCIAQKGARAWTITARGRAAHSSTPHLGVNAISYMARLVVALEEKPFPYTRHAVLGDPTVSVVGFECPPTFNVVPDLCTITASIRRVPGQSDDELDVRLQHLLEEVAASSGLAVTTEFKVLGGIPALETGPDHPLVRGTVAAIKAIHGVPPALKGFTGGTEAALLCPAFNLPFVIFGPGKLEQAHMTDEYVDVEELEIAARVYTQVAMSLLQAED